MKRTDVYSGSPCSSRSYQNGGEDHSPRSHERGVGVPPPRTHQHHHSQLPRPAPRQVDFSRNTFHASAAAAGGHHHLPSSTYFARSVSLTDIPTPNDDGAPHHSDMIDRSLSHSLTRSIGDVYQDDAPPVFRSVAVQHGLAESWMAPPQLSKHSPWDHTSSSFTNDKMSAAFSSNGNGHGHGHTGGGSDLSMKMPNFGHDDNGDSSSSSGRRHRRVADYTTFETLQAVCSGDRADAITLQAVPDYVEPFCTFEVRATSSAAVALSIGRFLDDRSIVFHFVAEECQFEARAATDTGFQLAFNVTVFDLQRERDGEDVQCLIEFQRRQGDPFQFATLYKDAKEHLVRKMSDKANSEQQQTESLVAAAAAADESEASVMDDDAVDDADVRLQCAVLLCDNIPADNEFSPSKAMPTADASMLATLNDMIHSDFFEEQFSATSAVARLTAASEANCHVILHDEASMNGLLESFPKDCDMRVKLGAATSVANLVSQPEHVPRDSLNDIVVALIDLLLTSSSLEVVRESARALVSLADLSQEFEFKISPSISSVFEKLDATRDKVAVGYRMELARKVGVPSSSATPSYA